MNYNLSNNYEAMYHGAVNAGVQYLLKHKSVKSMIVGVSGGIDSAIICMLARAVCNKLIDRKVVLIGRSIAIESNTSDEIDRSKGVGKAFCDFFKHIDLTATWQNLANTIESGLSTSLPNFIDSNSKVRAGNIKARLRMMYLYNLASGNDGMVLSTDNLTEYMLGFWTLHGDVGDFGLIQNLWKTEVYGLTEWWVNNLSTDENVMSMVRCTEAVPTDGLGITNSDLDQLLPDGYGTYGTVHGFKDAEIDHLQGYRQVDNTLIDYLSMGSPHPLPKSFIKHASVIRRHLLTEFKRNNPTSVDRNLLIS